MWRWLLLLALQLPMAISGGPPPPPSPDAPEIATTAFPACQDNQALSGWDITATGGTGTYSSFLVTAGSLPGNASIATSGNQGHITGSDPGSGAYSFTVTVTDSGGRTDDQAYSGTCSAAGTTEGVLRTGHPRFHITPAGDSGYGIPLDTLRTRIGASYSADFQTFITAVNAVATATTGKGSETSSKCQDACADGIAFAFLALLDPGHASMSGFSWSGRTQADYISDAKAHALFIAANMLPTRTTEPWIEGQDSEQFSSEHQPNMALAVIYDWTTAAGETWSDADKRTLLDAGIHSYAKREQGYAAGQQFLSSGHAPWFLTTWPGLAFDSSEVPSGSLLVDNAEIDGVVSDLTQTYAQWVIDIKVAANLDWFDTSGSYDDHGWAGHLSTIYITGHNNTQSAGNLIGTSYNEQAGHTNNLLALTVKSLYNYDLATNQPFWANWGLWMLNMLRPVAHATGAGGHRYEHRFGVAGPFVSLDSGNARYALTTAAALTNDTTLQRVVRWAVTTGYDNLNIPTSSGQRVPFWPFFHFLYGVQHLGAAMTPTAAGLATANAFGGGAYVMRSGYESAADSMVTFSAPQNLVESGHWRNNVGAFTLEHRGTLIGAAGNNKASVPTHLNFQSEDELDQSKMAVVMAGETGSYKALNNTTLARTGGMSIPGSVTTGYCATSFSIPYTCGVGSVSRYILQGASDDYDYLKYDYTSAWNTAKVSNSNREFIVRWGPENQRYLIVLDRVTAVNSAYPKLLNFKLPLTPTASSALTTVETGAGFVNEQGGIWTIASTYASPIIWTMSNTIAINDDGGTAFTGDARMFLKTLLPAVTWTRISGDFYEARDATASFVPYERGTKTIKSSSTTGGVTTVITSTSADAQDTGSAMLITGSSDANLNGFHSSITKVTNTTFTVPCASCGSGTGGKAITHIKTETGADIFGRARIQAQPAGARASDIFLTVIQFGQASTMGTVMTTATTLCSDTVDDDGCDGALVGVEIADVTEPFVYLASTSHATSTAVPTLPASVTLSVSGTIQALACNFTPSTEYFWKVTGASLELRTSNAGFSGTSVTAHATSGCLDFTFTR